MSVLAALASLFQAERIKWRRSWTFVVAVLVPLFQVFFLFMIFWFSEILVDRMGAGFPAWYKINYAAWNIIFMPVTATLVAVLSWDQEEEAGAWKHLFLQPVPRATHYLAKLLSHISLLFISQVLFASLLWIGGLILRKNLHYLEMGPALPGMLLRFALASLLASLPLIGLHTWMSTRMRGVGIGLGIALAGSWLSVQWAEKFLLVGLMPWGVSSQVVKAVQKGFGASWRLYLGGLVCALILMAVGTLDFSRREEQR